MEKPKIIKVIFELEDGSAEYLENEDLKRWLDDINGSLSLMQIRAGLPENFMRVEFKKAKSVTLDLGS